MIICADRADGPSAAAIDPVEIAGWVGDVWSVEDGAGAGNAGLPTAVPSAGVPTTGDTESETFGCAGRVHRHASLIPARWCSYNGLRGARLPEVFTGRAHWC